MTRSNRRTQQPYVPHKPAGYNGAEGFYLFVPANGFGLQRRNQLYGPRYFDTDLTVQKNFKLPISEASTFGIGFQFFNLFNHPNFDQPVGDISDPQFGLIRNTVSVPTSIVGSFLGGDASPRLIQLKASVTF